MKKRIKRIITFVLVFVMTILSLGQDLGTVNASKSSVWFWFELNGVSWSFVTDEGKLFGTMDIKGIEKNSVLEFPSFKKIVDNTDTSSTPWFDLNSCFADSTTNKWYPGIDECIATRCEQANVSTIMVYEDWPSFPCRKEAYMTRFNTVSGGIDPSLGIFYGNHSITDIQIDTFGKNEMEFCPAAFAGMTGLNKVNINVGEKELILDGSVFEGCTSLTSITLTGKSVKLVGGRNFAGCTSLENITINGSTTVSGEEDFTGCTSLKNVNFNGDTNFNGDDEYNTSDTFHNLCLTDATFRFGGRVSNGSGVSVINQCKGINTISFCGINNYLTQNFLKDSQVVNLNIENGLTTLEKAAICNTNMTGVSFNATTEVGTGALENCKVDKMYFNTSNVNGSTANAAIGKDTKVTNLYLNHYDISGNEDKVTELNGVPLGKLSCDKIYVLSPNFQSINNTAYPGGKQTEVYGYGGTIASYGETSYITGKEMFQKWMGENNGSYKNMIELTGEKPASVNLFVTNSTDKATFDLSTLKITAKYNDKAVMLDQLPVDRNGNVLNGTFELQYTNDPDSSTNFNYKILTKVDASDIQGEQYTYTDGEGNEYITCQEEKLELGLENGEKTTYRYYVQAAGEIWPLDVVVEQNTVKDLNVTIKDMGQKDGKLHVTVGDSLSNVKKCITVEAVLADGDPQELQSSQYTVVKTDLSNTPVTAQDTTLLVYHEESRKSIELKDVQIHEKKLTSFDVVCDKANMPVGSQLTLKNVTLTNGIYDNPLDTTITLIKEGYHFLQDGQETDVYTIKSGENRISVTYEGCVQEIVVTGVSNQVKDYEINCKVKEVELYQKSSLDISEVILEDVVYTDERLADLKVETVKSGFSFVVNGEETDTVELEDGENTIRVRYNGLDKKFTVKAYAQSVDRIEVSYCGPAVYEGNEVPKDTSVLLVTVYYKHPYEASVLLSNFEVSYETYHIIPGEDNEIYVKYKGVTSSKPIHVLGLADGLKEIKTVEYRGSKEAGTSLNKEDFYVELGYLSGKTVTSEENPAILEKLSLSSDKLSNGENTIEVTYDDVLTKEVKVSTGGQQVTEAPKVTTAPIDVPKETNSTQTPVPTTTPAITIAPSKVPDQTAVTQAPAGTVSPTIMPTATVVAQTQKDSSFMAQGVEYKVTGVTENGGSVSVVSYDKKASKVKIQTTVSFNGCQYKVTKIEKGAFKNCSKLSGTISLTKNVKAIGDSAFYGCKNINKVVFGDNVTRIGKSSFSNCRKLSLIQFKTGSVKEIGKNAFNRIAKKYKVKTKKMLQKSYIKRLKNAI